MNRSCIAFAAIAMLFAIGSYPVRGGDEAPPLRVDVVYASSLVFRGVERAGDSVQTVVEFNREGFRGGMWLSQPFDRDDPGEVSFNAAYARETSGGIGLEAMLAHTWFDDVPGVNRSLEAGVRVTSVPTGGFTPSLAFYHDFYFASDAAEAALARSIPLTKLGAFLELNLFAGWVHGKDWRPGAAGPRQRDGHGYWGGEVRLPYRIGPHSTVVASLHYAGTSGRSISNGPFGSRANDKFWVTLGVNLDF